MKRKFTLLIAALALLTMIVQPGRAWGQTKSEVTDVLNRTLTGVTETNYSSWTGKTSNSDAVWAGQSAGGNEAIQLRSSNNNSGIITTASGGTVTKVVVSWQSSTQSGRTLNVYGKSSAYSSPEDLYRTNNQGTLIGTIVCGTSTELTITGSYEYIGMRSASGAMYLSEVDVTWSTGDTPAVTHTLTVSANPTEGGTVTVGSTTLAEGATTSISATANSGYVFAGWDFTGTGSSVEDEDEASTTFTMGTSDATLTANFDEVQTYTVTYHANVTGIADIEVIYNKGQDVTVAANTFSNPGYAFTEWNTQADGDGVPYEAGDVIENIQADIDLYAQWEVSYETVDVLDLEFTGRPASTSYGDWSDKEGTSGAVYAGNSAGGNNAIQLRTTGSASGIVSTTSAGKVTKVEVQWNSNTSSGRKINIYGSNTAYTEASQLYNANTAGTLLGTIDYGSTTELTITGDYAYIGIRSQGNALYLDWVKITWATASSDVVATPVINPNGGSFWESQEVSISCATDGATIYYTTDGTDPTTGSAVYSASFTITATNTVKAFAVKADMTDSEIATAEFTKATPMTVAQALAVTPPQNGVYVSGIISEITEVSTQYHNATYKISDDGTHSSELTVFRGKYLNGADFTSEDQIQVGDVVVVYGDLGTYNEAIQLNQNNYLVSLVRPEKVATPTFSPAAGTYYAAQSVTIACATDGATIYYTTDGSNPSTESSVYSEDIAVNTTTTIKAFAVKAGINDSDIATAEYTIILTPSINVASNTINVGYASGNGTLAVTYQNITTVVAEVVLCDALGETATYDWFDAEINSSNNVDYIVFANDGEARNAYFKVHALDNNAGDVYSEIVTVTQAAFVVDYATLPFEFDGGRADIATTTGLTQEGLDTDYSSSPKLKFNGTGDWVILKINERPGTLTFDIKGNGFGNGSIFKLQTSADGTTYTDLKTYTELGATLNESFDNLGENVRYIKWIYTEKAQNGGNVALGNIALAQYTVPVPSISADDVAVAYDATSGSIMYTINNYVAGTMVATTEADWISDFTYNQVDEIGEVGFTTAANTGAERSATVTLTYTYDNSKATVTKDVTVTQNGTPSITVTPATANVAFAGGTPEFAVTYESLEITKADDFDVKFYETPTSTTAGNQPSWITNVAITGNTTDGFTLTVTVAANDGDARDAYLKVYAAGSNDYIYSNLVTINQAAFVQLTTYSLVTSVDQIVSGKHYLFVGYKGEVAYAMGYDKGNNRNAVEVTVDNNTIPETVGAYEFVINNSGEDWTIYDNNVQELNTNDTYGFLYAAGGTSNNYLKTRTTNNDDKGIWTITIDDETHVASITAKSTGRNKMRFNDGNSPLFSCYSNGQKDIYLYVKDNDNNLEYYGTKITYSGNSIPDGGSITVGAGSIMTVPNNFENNDPNALVIEEGGQLIHTNNLAATVQENVSEWTETGGWYLIASPVDGHDIESIIGATGTYDLFLYNEPTAQWCSHDGEVSSFTTLSRGSGYLYANETNRQLDFAGLMIGTATEVPKTLSRKCTYNDDNVVGYNLLGNPYTRNLKLGDITVNDNIWTSFLLLNNDEEYEVCNMASGDQIKPGQGFFIQAESDGQTLKFKQASSKDGSEIGLISIVAGNENKTDKAFIQIGGGNTLRKIAFTNSSSVYVMNHGDDYAAARVEELAGTMPVHFDAVEDGEYTITINAKNIEAHSMHLIDNFTGEVIDLLVNSSYTFIANESDDAARFTLMFDFNDYTGINESYVNGNFAYQNGDELIVNGDGTLQVFDVMGRYVGSYEVHGSERISVSAYNTGVYMLRFVGENVMTQKIVVR